MIFDSRDPRYAPFKLAYCFACVELQFAKHLGALSFANFGGKSAIDMLNPALYNHFDSTLKIKGVWDTENLRNINYT